MALFRRKRAAGTDAPPENGQAGREGGGQNARATAPQQGEPDPQNGPFDVDDLPTREGLVDLGGILLPGIQGLVVSMEMDLASGDVTAVRSVASLLDEFELVWRGRIDRIDALIRED